MTNQKSESDSQLDGVKGIFKLYWSHYGGWRALLTSPYLWAAFGLLILTAPTWLDFAQNFSDKTVWWDQVITVIPSLLGFTLGGFAIFVGFGDDKFKELLAEEGGDPEKNDYILLCVTFVHFIIVQTLALIAALLAQSWSFYTPLADPIRPFLPLLNSIGGALGYGLFLYAITCIAAATMHVLRIVQVYVEFIRIASEDKNQRD